MIMRFLQRYLFIIFGKILENLENKQSDNSRNYVKNFELENSNLQNFNSFFIRAQWNKFNLSDYVPLDQGIRENTREERYEEKEGIPKERTGEGSERREEEGDGKGRGDNELSCLIQKKYVQRWDGKNGDGGVS